MPFPRLRTTGLLALCVVPTVAGVIRLTELATGARLTPDYARYADSPVPIVLHIVGVLGYSILGAFQFVPGLRRHGWHRTAGRFLVPAGLVSALTGLWLTVSIREPGHDERLLEVFRIVFGLAMTASLVLGDRAIRQRDIAAHRAWMTRAYAIGLGAGTQAVLIVPITVIAGEPTGTARALLMGAGWAINLAVVERRRFPLPRRNPR